MERAIVLADGSSPTREALDLAWPGWDEDVRHVIAADGGARLGSSLGLPVGSWVGDGDSLDPEALARLQASGIPVVLASRDKNETDTELAVLAAVASGADDITIVGALGGARLDHALANVVLLGHPAIGEGRVRIRLLDPAARISVLAAPASDGGPATLQLDGPVGDLVTLLPFGADVEGVTTVGLRFALRDERLLAGTSRGVSNVRENPTAWVRIGSGRLLAVETPVGRSAGRLSE